MDFQLIKCKEAPAYMNRRDVMFLDLRPRGQYEQFHLPGAGNYPYDRFSEWENSLPKGKLIVLYCEHGNLSLMAAKRLGRKGLNVAALIGGINCFMAQNPIDTLNWKR